MLAPWTSLSGLVEGNCIAVTSSLIRIFHRKNFQLRDIDWNEGHTNAAYFHWIYPIEQLCFSHHSIRQSNSNMNMLAKVVQGIHAKFAAFKTIPWRYTVMLRAWSMSLQWRHNGSDGILNHQRLACLLSFLFRHRSKKTSKLPVACLCEGNIFPFDDVIMWVWNTTSLNLQMIATSVNSTETEDGSCVLFIWMSPAGQLHNKLLSFNRHLKCSNGETWHFNTPLVEMFWENI